MLPSNRAFMLKSCWINVTSFGVKPACVSPAKTSYSLREAPRADLLAREVSGFGDVLVLETTPARVGDRWKV
jgi:hypothetical protein